MTTKAAKALTRHFDEPLSDEDLAAIAMLTRLDVSALKIAAGMNGPDGGPRGCTFPMLVLLSCSRLRRRPTLGWFELGFSMYYICSSFKGVAVWGLLVAAGNPSGRWRCTCPFSTKLVVFGVCIGSARSSTPTPILSWNIRGLNTLARRVVVRETAELHMLSILCLQETKIESWDRTLACEVGGSRLADYMVFLL